MSNYAMTMQVEGLDAFQYALAQAPEIVREKMGQALLDSARLVQEQAKANAPFRVGQLRDSITLTGPKFSSDNIQVAVYTNVKYAPYQEFGTGVYGPNATPIVPKSAPFLVFQLADGSWRKTKSVQGVKPVRFMGKAVDSTSSQFDENLAQGLLDVVEALATI